MADFIDDAASDNGIDADYLRRTMQIESGGNPRAVTGSYKGLFQLSNSEFNKYGGGNIFNPIDNAGAAARKTAAETANFQDKYGRGPTPTELYMIHQQGAAGFAAHTANPDAPAWENMASTGEGKQKGDGWARQAIWGNIPDQYKAQFGNVNNVTSRDFMNMWRNQFEGTNPGQAGALSYASQPAALSGAGQQAINSALSNTANNSQPNGPALSANFLTGGLGSLARNLGSSIGVHLGSNDDIRNGLQTAAAYGMALDTKGASLGALPNMKGEFSLVSGGDGSTYRIDNRTGQVTPVSGPQPKITKVGSGPLGDIMGIQRGQKIYGMNGALLMDLSNPGAVGGAPSGGGAAGTSSDPGLAAILRPGTTYDDSLPGLERLDQFKPEYKQGIIDYMNGDRMPTGRGDKYTQWIKDQAGRVAAETGQVANDATFAAKRTALNDLNKATPGSAGGQAIAALTTLEHNGRVLDAYQKLNNIQMPGGVGWIPGSAGVAHVLNNVGNTKASYGPALKEVQATTARTAEESSRYYAGNQAAQAERDRIHNLYGENLQPSESIATVASERNTLSDRANEAIGNLTSTLGANHPKVLDLQTRLTAALTKLDAKIGAAKQRLSGTPTNVGTRPALDSFYIP
jgi:hypothetical protein